MPLPPITRVSNLQVTPSSTNKEKGFYTAPLTTAQRDAITQTDGSFIYNTTTGTFQGRQNGVWNNINTQANFALKRTAVAADYTVLTTDVIIGVTDTTAARIITLPLIASTIPGQIFIIKDETAAGANSVTIARNGTNIDGAAANVIIGSGVSGVVSLYSNGAAWFTIEKRIA